MSDVHVKQVDAQVIDVPATAETSATKKNKANASALQKEINNMEKIRSWLALTAEVEGIPELDEDFKKTLREADEAVVAVSAKLTSARKVYAKDIPIHVKKTSTSTGLNYKSYSVK